MKIITTERLTLRHFRPSDLYDFYEYAKDDAVGPNAGWRPHASMDETRRVLSRYITSDLIWAIVENKSAKMIGSISLGSDRMRDMDSALRLGYSMNPAFWGRGYMTEAARAIISFAFEELNVEIIAVDHFPDNLRSQRVVEKCGFRYEGVIRRALRLYDGRICDLMTYSLSSDEFFAAKSSAGAYLHSAGCDRPAGL